MGWNRTRAVPLLWGSLLLPLALPAAEQPLPEPLTLEYALSLADEPHPDLQRYRARLHESEAYREEVDAEYATTAHLRASLRAVDPSYKAVNETHNDSSLKLVVRKKLYDFGRSEARFNAAISREQGSEWDYLDLRQKRRLEILRNYFDVLLADLRYMRDNEYMTVAFLRWNKLQDTLEMENVSDIDLLEKESEFRRLLKVRTLTENRQRLTRAKLAISLNRPGQLSSELTTPDLPMLNRELGEVKPLQQQALQANPHLKALRARVKAADQALRAAQASDNPTLHGELEASAYSRTTGTRDPLAAALVFEMPLSTGGALEARVATERARLWERQAELAEAENSVRQAVLEIFLQLQTLKLQQQEMQVLGDYRELYLDRSRALYELEVKSDLGDAEGRVVDYQLQKAETEYEITMAWARMDALLGKLIENEREEERGE